MLGASAGWQHVLREDVAPVLSGYLFFVGTAMAHARSARRVPLRAAAAAGEARPTPMDFARYLATTLIAGYVVFLAIVVVFYFVLGNQHRSFIADALARGSLLTFVIVLPGFVVLTLAEEGLRRLFSRRSRLRR